MRLSPTAQQKQSDRRLSPQPHDENDQPKMNHNTFFSNGVSRHGANKDVSPRGDTSAPTGLFPGFKKSKEQQPAVASPNQQNGLNLAHGSNVARTDAFGVEGEHGPSSLEKGKLSSVSKTHGEKWFDETSTALKNASPMRPSSFSKSDSEDRMLLFPRKAGDSTIAPVETTRESEETSDFADIGREFVQDSAVSNRASSKSTLDATKQHANTPPRPIVQRRKPHLDGVSLSSSDHQQQHLRRSLPASLPLARPHQRSASPNKIPRAPRQTLDTSSTNSSNSKRRLSKDVSMNLYQSTSRSISSGQGSGSDGHGSAKRSPSSWKWGQKTDAMEHGQALFEQRLCEDSYGVAVRKINQKGKSNLRYVKCVTLEKSQSHRLIQRDKRSRVLTWGKKKDVRISLDKFVSVRMGKTTDRARRNPSPSYRVLSLITNDPDHPSLDIEAPTRLDRDKFSLAFARFLEVPLVEEGLSSSQSVTHSMVDPYTMRVPFSSASTAISAPERVSMPNLRFVEKQRPQRDRSSDDRRPERVDPMGSKFDLGLDKVDSKQKPSSEGMHMESQRKDDHVAAGPSDHTEEDNWQIASNQSSVRGSEISSTQNATGSPLPSFREDEEVFGADAESQVSSLTGAGFDQEIVEELHQALNDLRAELEESRAEAARAVKVAEQAIQSAENSSSKDWNATVTHKAAEAAALAQKKSAEAMAKQRLAEEMLEGEKRNVSFWRSQAEAFEEQAGVLQTKAAAAEVQKAELMEKLECERRRNLLLMERMQNSSSHHSITFEKRTATRDSDYDRTPLHSKHLESQQNRPGESRDGESFLLDTFASLNVEAANDYEALPPSVRRWADEAFRSISSHRSEIDLLRHRVALETSTRRKLLEEIQDLRGSVRVYCRPRACSTAGKDLLSFPSQDSLALHRGSGSVPLSFKFDRVFQPDVQQNDVYNEIEDACLGALDGYNICFMAHGQTGSGKTHTLLGDINHFNGNDEMTLDKMEICNYGIQLRAIRQLLSVSEQRRNSYIDKFSLSVLEVHNERLCDLIVGTEIGESCGEHCFEDGKVPSKRVSRSKKSFDDGSASLQPNSVSSKIGLTKLEIRTSQDGDTTVQGLLSVKLQSFSDAIKVWEQCLMQRAKRLLEQGINIEEYNASGHMIATLSVVSTKIDTGVSTLGKLKFVDLAGADLMPPPQALDSKKNMAVTEEFASAMGNKEWKFRNKSLATFGEVANCRSNFMRSVPYRNSTLTHLLRDDLESDTKLYFFVCVSSNQDDANETACSLRFATRMAQITIGKATKHTLSRE